MGNQRQTAKLTNGLQLHDSCKKKKTKQSVTTTKKGKMKEFEQTKYQNSYWKVQTWKGSNPNNQSSHKSIKSDSWTQGSNTLSYPARHCILTTHHNMILARLTSIYFDSNYIMKLQVNACLRRKLSKLKRQLLKWRDLQIAGTCSETFWISVKRIFITSMS